MRQFRFSSLAGWVTFMGPPRQPEGGALLVVMCSVAFLASQSSGARSQCARRLDTIEVRTKARGSLAKAALIVLSACGVVCTRQGFEFRHLDNCRGFMLRQFSVDHATSLYDTGKFHPPCVPPVHKFYPLPAIAVNFACNSC